MIQLAKRTPNTFIHTCMKHLSKNPGSAPGSVTFLSEMFTVDDSISPVYHTLYLLVPSADKICKEFEPRSYNDTMRFADMDPNCLTFL